MDLLVPGSGEIIVLLPTRTLPDYRRAVSWLQSRETLISLKVRAPASLDPATSRKVSEQLLFLAAVKSASKYLSASRRRAVTIDTMIALAARHVPSEITTSAIAARMNVTQGALFRHFTSKDAMWHAAMERVAEQLLARIDRAVRHAPSPLAALEAAFMAHLDFVARHPGIPRMLFGELQRAGQTAAKQLVRRLLTQYAQRLHALLEQGKAQGEVATDVDVNAAATFFIGLIQGLIMQSLVTGEMSRLRSAGPGVFVLFARGVRKSS